MRKLLILVTLLMSQAVFSGNENMPTKTLMDGCSDKNNPSYAECQAVFATYAAMELFLAISYINGANDIATAYQIKFTEEQNNKIRELADKRVDDTFGCIRGKNHEQLAAVFVKWAKENPEKWHQLAIASVVESTSTSLRPPC